MFCSKCGKKVSDESSFCWNCGAKIVKEPIDEQSELAEGKLVEKNALIISKNRGFSKEVGSIITFGNYPQGPNGEIMPIEWQILDKQGNKVLVVSKYALDCQRYNIIAKDVTWETCTLRKWLNGLFVPDNFNSDEQKKILVEVVPADKNPIYSTEPGNATNDKAFLLSINEVNRYFSSAELRKSVPTDYIKKNGIYTSDAYKVDGKDTCRWWLRTPGNDNRNVAYVDCDGSVRRDGDFVRLNNVCVRPALWVELDN